MCLRTDGFCGSYRVLLLLCLLPIVISSEMKVSNEIFNRENVLHHPPMYLVVVPSLVRPGQQVNVYVSLFRLIGPSVRVSLSIRREQVEYAGTNEKFTMPGSKILQMKMRASAEPGDYTIRLEGTTGDGSVGVLFVNETKIHFHPKRVSCFIQTDRPMYKMGHKVRFRVIAITQNQLPVKAGSITIYAKDGKGHAVQRWVGRNLFNGVYEGSFTTTHPMQYGWWTLEVHGWGYVYSQKFRIEAHFPELFYVNISMPSYVKEKEFALAGVITANLTHGKSMDGNATIFLDVTPPGGSKQEAVLKQVLPHFKGVGSFLFPLEAVAPYASKLVGTKLHVRAVVTDFFFLMERSWTQTAVIYDSQVRLSFLSGHVRVFRPGVPLDIHVAVYETDGCRLSRRNQRTLVVEADSESDKGISSDRRRILVVPDSSVVSFNLQPKEGAYRITVRAYYSDQQKNVIEMVASRHYTKSKKYLTVSTSTRNPEVDRYMVFTVRSSIRVTELHYMIISGGAILLASTTPMTSRQKTFSLALSRDMVPESRMLVYCHLPDGEVLADSLSFHVDGMTSNNILVQGNKGKDFSGKTIEITARTYPGTFIAFSAMHYDWYKHGGNRDSDANIFFTKTAVEEELSTYDSIGNHSFSHTWLLGENRRERDYYNAPSSGIDANMTFTFSGVNVLTDAIIPRIPGIWTCNFTLGFEPCFRTGCFLRSQRCDGIKQCADGADEIGCIDPKVVEPKRPDEFSGVQRMWYYFDSADWAWGNFYTKPKGNIEFRVPMPIRPTTWMVGAFGLNVDHGLVFTHQPARVGTTRPFYIQVDMVSKAVRGEQLGVRVTAFNYWDRPIEAILTLAKSENYAFVHVEDKGKISSYSPRTSKSTIQTMVHLRPGDQRFVFFPVLPLVLGKVKIMIKADSPVNSYKVTKTVTIRMDGVTNVYHTPYLINLVSQGSVIIPNFEIPVEERFYSPEERQQLYVPGSAKATMTVVGDVMGPGLFAPSLSQGSVTGFRDGDGHTYVFTFAVNLYWLQFLRHIKQLDGKTRDGALNGMILSFKSIMPYLRTNDAMALRRGRTKPNVWLSAFALQSLAAGSDPELEDTLYIDVSILNKMALYLVKQQQTNGAFRWNTHVVDRAFDNQFFEEDGTPLNISLTAFVAISLARSVHILTGEAKSKADASKDLAADYLALHLQKLKDPFQLCLVTYALYVTDHRVKGQAFEKVRQAKRMDNYIYWSAVQLPHDPVEIINTVPFQFPRPLPPLEEMKAIQATSYALLVYLLNNRFQEAEPIMIWLQRQRYSDHGFSGAQATIIALQALKEYGEHVTNRDIYRMSVKLEATADPSLTRQFNLNKGNFFQYLKFQASKKRVWGSIRASARGTGLALLQMTTEVNVEYKHLLRSQKRGPEMRSFDLDIDKVLFYGRNGSLILYNICMRWTRPDIAPTSGAAVLEIDIPSGYFILKRHIVGIVKAGPLNQHRPRNPWGKALFYYDYIGTTRQCVEFRAERWFPVANGSIQHRVRIFDTYNPGFENTTLYTSYTLFHLHICQVCGSFQCPYCPFYNTASLVSIPVLLLLVSSVLTHLVRYVLDFIT